MNMLMILLLCLQIQLKLGHTLNRNEDDGHAMLQHKKDFTVCSNKEYPFVVSVSVIKDEKEANKHLVQVCIGTLLKEKWVLTAGSCVSEYVRANASVFLVQSVSRTDPGANVTNTYIHPDYLKGADWADTAMLHLSNELVEHTDAFAYVVLPTFEKSFKDIWNKYIAPHLVDVNIDKKQLQCTAITVRPLQECRSRMGNLARTIDLNDNYTCTDCVHSTSCPGQLGAPIIANSNIQIGIHLPAICKGESLQKVLDDANVELYLRTDTITDFVFEILGIHERPESEPGGSESVHGNGVGCDNGISYTILFTNLLLYLIIVMWN